MGTWSVSTSGENYIMEYSNGFKRSIRKNQVIKSNTYLGEEYSSSQSPNLLLATEIASVRSYFAGKSTIDFTNNGGDAWDIGFKISMDSEQLPSGQTIDDYDIDVYHYVSGVGTQIEQSNRSTDHVVNTSGNGAGVYSVEQAYNVYDNGNYVTSITQQSLYKVDALGNLEAYFKGKGIIVNSVNGLDINVSAVVEQSENYPIEWYSFDGNNAQQLIGTGETVTLTLPSNCIFIIAQAVIDSVFTNDCPQSPYNLSSIIIN